MSTIRATYVQHGSSAVPNITLNASGQVIVASGIVSSGTFAAPSGSAAAPGVYFVGDADTGLYSPGANQVAISTSGTGRLFVDASGRVLTGTSSSRSQGQAFQVEGIDFPTSSALLTRNTNNTTSSVFTFLKTRGTALGSNTVVQAGDRLGRVEFQGADGTTGAIAAQVEAFADGTPTTNSVPGYLTFSTTAPAASAPTERLRITSAGLVGIGTSAPSTTLDVSGNARVRTGGKAGSNTYLTLESSDVSNSMALSFANSTNANWQIQAVENGVAYRPLILNPAGGNVGIGTTNPGGNFHVESAAASAGWSVLVKTNGVSNESGFYRDASNNFEVTLRNGGGGLAYIKNGGGASTPHLTFNIPSEAARIDSSGRLLVGTSTTSAACAALFAGGEASDTVGQIVIAGKVATPANGADLATISFNDSSHIYNNALIRAQRDGGTWTATTSKPTRLTFSTTADGASSPTERMRISQSGTTGLFTAGDVLDLRNANGAGTVYAFLRGYHSAGGTAGGGTVSFAVYTNGNVQNTNNSYTALSDIKLKENVVDANSQWDDIKALQIRNYNLKEGPTHKQIGLIAQEVEPISPGLVYETPDRDEDGNDLGTTTKAVQYSVLYMKAVKALQEAMERIEQLETSNADLLARVTALESA